MITSLSLQTRIDTFVRLGIQLSNLSEEEQTFVFQKAENQNPWFIPASLNFALLGICRFLEKDKMEQWITQYQIPECVQSKEIGVLMAGNLPAVGFHDVMCVLISGHSACIKLSSADSVLPLWLIEKLIAIKPEFASFIQVAEMLKAKDAYIATGSTNSARYFDYYFGKYPHIIRSNRTSVAILTGEETFGDLENLGRDIFQYFGLGCRNVSKLFVKSKDSIPLLLDALEQYSYIASHHKYLNNYEYNKSIYLVNREDHLDNGFLLIRQSPDLFSPIGVIFYETYDNKSDLNLKLEAINTKIQCVIGNPNEEIPGLIPFGKAQLPDPWEYADKVDTMDFLLSLV